MTAEELLESAERVGESRPENAVMALEIIAGHGLADEEVARDGIFPDSLVRVEDWLLFTDSLGFKKAERCHSVLEAELRVEQFEKGEQDG